MATAARAADGYWVFTTGQVQCSTCYLHPLLALSENHTALKPGQHCASGNKHCQTESLHSEGCNSAFSPAGVGDDISAMPRALYIISVPPRLGCSSLFEDCSWAMGVLLLAWSEKMFTSPLRARLWTLSSLTTGLVQLWGISYPPEPPLQG